MPSYNKLIIVGHLTRDPKLETLSNGTSICKCGIASNHKWKDKDGNSKEQVCFLDISIFGRSAETFNQYMAKGRAVLLEGRLDFQQWTDNDNNKRSKHVMNVSSFTFLGDGKSKQENETVNNEQPKTERVEWNDQF